MSNTAGPNNHKRRHVVIRSWPLAISLRETLRLGLGLTLGLTLALSIHGPEAHAEAASVQPNNRSAMGPATEYDGLQRQIELGEYEPAISQLERQVETIEDARHRYHPDLIKPLTLLGDALHGAKNFPGALDAYGRAIHLTRVNSGLHSAEQVEGVYREAKVYRSAGDLQQANNREEYAWDVLQKTHGRYSPKLLPGIHHLAKWYGKTYNVIAARGLYMRAVRIVEANYTEQHPEMVIALRGLAQTYRLERFPPTYLNSATSELSSVTARSPMADDNSAILLNRFPRGEQALKRIVRIQQANLAQLEPVIASATEVTETDTDAGQTQEQPAPTVTDPETVAKARQKLVAALVDLGDWYLLFERSSIAMQYYTQAEVINAQLSAGQTKLDFSRPQLLHFPAPLDPRPPKPRFRGERKEGFVELNYTITVRGSIANLETVSSAPKGLMDYRVRKSMLAARYRPTFVSGAPVSTQGHSYRHKFTYYPSQPDPAKRPEAETEAESSAEPTASQMPGEEIKTQPNATPASG